MAEISILSKSDYNVEQGGDDDGGDELSGGALDGGVDGEEDDEEEQPVEDAEDGHATSLRV